jgi:hypothetical protein
VEQLSFSSKKKLKNTISIAHGRESKTSRKKPHKMYSRKRSKCRQKLRGKFSAAVPEIFHFSRFFGFVDQDSTTRRCLVFLGNSQ